SIHIHSNARWKQNGTTVSGGNGLDSGLNQLNNPLGLDVNDDQTIYVADLTNHRIIEWKLGATSGKVRDSLITSDSENERLVRWPRYNGTSGETIISNIHGTGLAMDNNGSLYGVDEKHYAVRRYQIGDTEGAVVGGGNGKRNRLDQLSSPQLVFVDRHHPVYVSDLRNHRVMKWEEGAKQGIVVASGQGQGNSLTQLSVSLGVFVDQLGTVYVADRGNDRIMRWPTEATQESVIIGENGTGAQSNQFSNPIDLAFDRHGSLYVTDLNNNRVQRFSIL
ncbi:unnamed protein product, partial [Rotaria sp. Silwood2]